MGLKSSLAVLSLFMFLAPVIFVSGCTEGGDLQSIFSSITGQQEKLVAPKDVILVENVQVIPNPPITASSDFTLAFQVVNVGDAAEGTEEAQNVHVVVYDWGGCSPLGSDNKPITPEPDEVYGIGSDPETDSSRTIYPGGAELVELNFKAPENSKLGYMEGSCPIRYKVLYEYDAYTTSSVAIIDRDRLLAASRSGEDINVNTYQTQSRGPLKISVDFEAEQPVDENLVVPVIIKVRDEGSGMYEKVLQNKLVIDFPDGFTIVSCSPLDWISYGGIRATNSKGDITLINGESPPIRCDISLDPSERTSLRDIRTYTIRAFIRDYNYPLYGERTVAIKPTYGAEDEMGGGSGGDGTGDTDEEEEEDTTTELCVDQGTDCECGSSLECAGFDIVGEEGDFDCDSGEFCCCVDSGNDGEDEGEEELIPDLVMGADYDFSFTPEDPSVGEEVTFTATYANEGTGDAYYEGGIKMSYCTASHVTDPYYVTVGNTLAAGSTETQTFTMTFDEEGEYQVFAEIDKPDDVEESSEGNNFYWVMVDVSA